MEPTLEIFGTHIIVLGSFNPPVISPAWLRKHDLIGDDDAKAAMENETLAITPDISRFETEWFTLQVVKQQFALTSKGPVTPALKDLFISIFTLLEHTPITALGLNHRAEYKVASLTEYHKVGDVLAPKDIWSTFFPESDTQSVGLHQLTITVSPWKRDEKAKPERQRRITVGPSDKLDVGVSFVLNDHFPLVVGADSNSRLEPTTLAIQNIETYWQSSMDESKELFSNVLNMAIKA